MPKLTRALAILLAVLMAFTFAACSAEDAELALEIADLLAESAAGAEAEPEYTSVSEPEPTAEAPPAETGPELTAEPTDEPTPEPTDEPTPAPTPAPEPTDEPAYIPEEGGYYYDLESVVLYLYHYGELPPNYITKAEAAELGWEGGTPERYLEGAAIGGDRFGNREGLLPKADGRKYTECDLYTLGENSRGANRLVFSNDGLYFYTADHYESFDEVYVAEDGTVQWK